MSLHEKSLTGASVCFRMYHFVVWLFGILLLCSINFPLLSGLDSHHQQHSHDNSFIIDNIPSHAVHLIEFLEPCRQYMDQVMTKGQKQLRPVSRYYRNLIDVTTTTITTINNRSHIEATNDVTEEVQQQRRNKISSLVGAHYEVNLKSLFDELTMFPNFDNYLFHQISTTRREGNHSIKLQPKHPPYIFFDQQRNRTHLTTCQNKNNGNNQHRENKNNERLWNSFRNRRIVFMGDSVTRFQYLDLVYFLTHKQWNGEAKISTQSNSSGNQSSSSSVHTSSSGHDIDDSETFGQQPGLVNIYHFRHNWSLFFKSTNAYLSDYELCECFRYNSCYYCDVDDFAENRKFHHPELNVTIWYFIWFGPIILPRGTFDVFHGMNSLPCMPSGCQLSKENLTVIEDITDVMNAEEYRNTSATHQNHNALKKHLPAWTVSSVATFIDIFVRLQNPDYVVLNTGFHGKFAESDASLFKKYVTSWREHDNNMDKEKEGDQKIKIKKKIKTKLIFKSTTPIVEEIKLQTRRELDSSAVKLATEGILNYWNVSGEVLEPLYWTYHRLETPYVYYSDHLKTRGFAIDKFHFTPWVYSEINKAFIERFLTS